MSKETYYRVKRDLLDPSQEHTFQAKPLQSPLLSPPSLLSSRMARAREGGESRGRFRYRAPRPRHGPPVGTLSAGL
jgi:hypothetical protein